MKFEQLLNIYWKNSYFMSNFTLLFTSPFKGFFEFLGLNYYFFKIISYKFELNIVLKFLKLNSKIFTRTKRRLLNILLAKYYNVNRNLYNLLKYNLLRLYLIKSFRGFCLLLSKPVHAQRTRSNHKAIKHDSLFLKKILRELTDTKKKKYFSKKNYFVTLKKKVKKTFFKKKRFSKLDELLKIKTWF